jgi:hypothetical protein
MKLNSSKDAPKFNKSKYNKDVKFLISCLLIGLNNRGLSEEDMEDLAIASAVKAVKEGADATWKVSTNTGVMSGDYRPMLMINKKDREVRLELLLTEDYPEGTVIISKVNLKTRSVKSFYQYPTNSIH